MVDIYLEAVISQTFNKGDSAMAPNYRSISFISIACKLTESGMSAILLLHLDKNILNNPD